MLRKNFSAAFGALQTTPQLLVLFQPLLHANLTFRFTYICCQSPGYLVFHGCAHFVQDAAGHKDLRLHAVWEFLRTHSRDTPALVLKSPDPLHTITALCMCKIVHGI